MKVSLEKKSSPRYDIAADIKVLSFASAYATRKKCKKIFTVQQIRHEEFPSISPQSFSAYLIF